MPVLKTAIFESDDRTYTLPGFQYLTECNIADPGDPIQITMKAMTLASMLRAKLTWRDFRTSDAEPWTANIPCAVGSIGDSVFEHGGCRAWIFSGPEFDDFTERQVYA